MTVRFKILALSLALLAILCAALLVALHLQREVHDEIATITEYHLPLGALLADTDAAVLDYQLNLARVTGKAATPGLDATVEKREREIVARLNRQLDDADSMVARAVDDPRNDLSDRITFARMQGSLKLLRREVAPLEAAGRRTLEAWRAGDRADKFEMI